MPLYLSAYATPATITPNGDGVNDVATVSCYAYSPTMLRVAVADRTGAEVLLLQDWTPVTLGIWPVTWDGKLPVPGERGRRAAGDQRPLHPHGRGGRRLRRPGVGDREGGRQRDRHRCVAQAGVVLAQRRRRQRPDRRSPTSSNATRRRSITIGPASAPLRIFTPGRESAGVHQIAWDGLDDYGQAVPDGSYRVAVRATDDTGSALVVKSVAIDTVRPRPIAVEPAAARQARGAHRRALPRSAIARRRPCARAS